MEPRVGDFVKPDEWKIGETLVASDGFKDATFPGCSFRMPAGAGLYQLAVNVTVTGKNPNRAGMVRCRIEFVGDGDASTFAGGWIALKGGKA